MVASCQEDGQAFRSASLVRGQDPHAVIISEFEAIEHDRSPELQIFLPGAESTTAVERKDDQQRGLKCINPVAHAPELRVH